MITVDAGRRAARLEELMQALERHADPADRELLRSFAPVVYDSLPDAVALGLSLDALTRRVIDYFRFFVREFPPPTQALPGPPRHPRRGAQPGGGRRAAHRARPVPPPRDHHRRDAYPGRALHLREPQELLPPRRPPRLLGDPPDADGAPPVGAHGGRGPFAGRGVAGIVLPFPYRARRFQGAPRPHRARDLLGAEGGVHRGRGLRRHAPGGARAGPEAARPQGRRGARGARARLPGVAARRQLHLPGHGEVRPRPRRPLRARAGDGHRRLHRPRPAAGGLPGADGRGRDPPRPQRCRPPHRRHRLLQQRDGDLPPRAHRRHRDPAVGGRREPAGDDAPPRAAVHGRVHGKGLGDPAAEGKTRVDPGQQRGGAEVVRLPRDPRFVQPLPQARAVLRQRAQPEGRHRAHRLHDRRRRRGRPFAARRGIRRAFHRLLAPPLLVQGRGGPEARLDRGLRTHRVQQLDGLRCGDPAPVLLRLLAHGAAGGQRGGPPHDRGARHHLGGPRGGRPRGRPGRSPKGEGSSRATSARRAAAACTASRRLPRRCPQTSATSRTSRAACRSACCRAPRERSP